MTKSINWCGTARANTIRLLLLSFCMLGCVVSGVAQSGGTVRGTVTFQATGTSAAGASVILSPTGRITRTNENGAYEFTNVPAGRYEVIVRFTRFPDMVARVDLTGSTEATADLALQLAGVKEEVTVTASSADESTVNAIRSTEVLDSIELTERTHTALGEVLYQFTLSIVH